MSARRHYHCQRVDVDTKPCSTRQLKSRATRDFVDAPQPVRMFIRGRHYRGSARTILDDPELKADVFSRLRPTVPAWLPDALNGKLVVVTLEE